MEECLLEWILGRRSNEVRVSRKLIAVKAKSIYDEKCNEECEKEMFIASDGWLTKFMRRNGLSLRRKTTAAQQEPSYLIAKLMIYILYVRRLSRRFSHQPGSNHYCYGRNSFVGRHGVQYHS